MEYYGVYVAQSKIKILRVDYRNAQLFLLRNRARIFPPIYSKKCVPSNNLVQMCTANE